MTGGGRMCWLGVKGLPLVSGISTGEYISLHGRNMQHNMHRLSSSVTQRVTGRSGGQGIARARKWSQKVLSSLERVLVSYRVVRGLLQV